LHRVPANVLFYNKFKTVSVKDWGKSRVLAKVLQ
jgi:hypothetical protein